MMFTLFSSTVCCSAIECDCAFYELGDLAQTRLLGHMTRFKMAENICTIFSHSNLSAFVHKKKEGK